jgi:aldehyde dehydrogenase (NAD+)
VITREQGKLLSEARGEVARARAVLEFTAGQARLLGGVTAPAEEDRTFAYTFRRPIGVVGLVSPWNFPLAIPVWKVAPALLSGCTAVLKPSPLTPLTSALLVDTARRAGLPDGVLNLVQGDAAAGEALVAHPDVAGISFTGSLAVGTAIHTGGAPRLLRTQLELGGKNAVIVLDDADLDRAVDAVVLGAFGQAGQRCSATSRAVVDHRVRDAFLDRLVDRVAAMRVGPGDDPASQICPVVDTARMEAALHAVAGARRDGGKVLCGGERADDPGLPEGCYVRPTVIRDVPWDSELAQEEVFGPVLAVVDADGFDDAMRIANSVKYGMSGTVFTASQARAFEAVACCTSTALAWGLMPICRTSAPRRPSTARPNAPRRSGTSTPNGTRPASAIDPARARAPAAEWRPGPVARTGQRASTSSANPNDRVMPAPPTPLTTVTPGSGSTTSSVRPSGKDG